MMRTLILFLAMLGFSYETKADHRVAVDGVPVLGLGLKRLWTAPPNMGNAHDGFAVPYHQTHYARNHPSHLTLGGTYAGKAWYFNSNGYVSPHYGEHYMPTGGLKSGYIGEPAGYWSNAAPTVTSTGGTVYEAWVPIAKPAVPTMPVVTNPYPRYSGWYVNTPEFAGWVGDYATYWKYLSRHPTWKFYRGHLYDSRLYAKPPDGWEDLSEETPSINSPVPFSEPAPVTLPVKKFKVTWNDNESFTGTKSSWKLAPGEKPMDMEKTSEVRGYVAPVHHLNGERGTYFHLVDWNGSDWVHLRVFVPK